MVLGWVPLPACSTNCSVCSRELLFPGIRSPAWRSCPAADDAGVSCPVSVAANTTGAFNSNIEVVYSREEELNAEGEAGETLSCGSWTLQRFCLDTSVTPHVVLPASIGCLMFLMWLHTWQKFLQEESSN